MIGLHLRKFHCMSCGIVLLPSKDGSFTARNPFVMSNDHNTVFCFYFLGGVTKPYKSDESCGSSCRKVFA